MGVKEYQVGDIVRLDYYSHGMSGWVRGTIIRKWWSNRWQTSEPDPDILIDPQWFYKMEPIHSTLPLQEGSEVSFCHSSKEGESPRFTTTLVSRAMGPKYKLSKCNII